MDTGRKRMRRITVFTLCFYLASVSISLYLQIDGWTPGGVILGAGIMAAVYLVSGRIRSDRAAVLVLVLFGLAEMEIWNILIRPYPVSDYEVLWRGAHEILDGSFAARAADTSDYFCFYNFQIPFTAYLAALLRLFGSLGGVVAVRAAVPVMTGVVLYKTVRLYSGVREALFTALMYIAFPFIFFGSGVLNNQHECMLLEALGIYAFLRAGKAGKASPLRYILPGLLLSAANLFRPTASVICIALGIVLAARFFCGRDWKDLAGLALLAGAYLAVRFLADRLFTDSGIAPNGITIGNLWFKLSLGLTGDGITGISTTDAEHTNLFYDLQHYGFDYGAYNTAAFRYILGLVKKPFSVIGYVFGKVVNYAGTTDAQYMFTNPEFLESGRFPVRIVNGAGMTLYAVSLLGSLAGLRGKAGKEREFPAVWALIFLGYSVSYIFLEAQTRYRYEQYYALFLMGMPAVLEQADSWIRRMKERRTAPSGGTERRNP